MPPALTAAHRRPTPCLLAALPGARPLAGPRSPGFCLGRRALAAPLSSAVLYELHIDTFTPAGAFDAAIARLDHLVELGITHVELMAVTEFPRGQGWGYDGIDLYAPHHAY